MRNLATILCWGGFVGMVMSHGGLAMGNGNNDVLECTAAYVEYNYEMALTLCSRALLSGDLSDQQTANALNTRGAVYVGKGDYDKAVHDLDEAIRLKPESATAYSNRGNAHSGNGEYDRAIQDFNQAIRLKPDDEAAYVGRATTYANKGEHNLAIRDYDHAIRLNPNAIYVSLWRAQVQFEIGRFSDAADALGKLVNAHPEFAEGPLWLFLAQRRAGDTADDALKAHAKALDLEKWPGPVIRFFLGQISLDAARAGALAPDAKTPRFQSCEAAFYVAELDLTSGRAKPAKAGFQHVIDSCSKSYVVVRIAKLELGRM
jgi:lipoprotein NlpI